MDLVKGFVFVEVDISKSLFKEQQQHVLSKDH